MKLYRIWAIYLLASACMPMSCYCQIFETYYSIKLDENNLLNTNTVYDCTYDDVGNLWLATNAGVSRYNGIGIVNYTTTNGLSDNDILLIYSDRIGNIWMICNNGKLCFYSNLDKIIHNSKDMPFLSLIEDGSRIVDIFQASNREFYISTFKNSFKIDIYGKIAKIKQPPTEFAIQSNFIEVEDKVFFINERFIFNATDNTCKQHGMDFFTATWIAAAYYNQKLCFNNRNEKLYRYSLVDGKATAEVFSEKSAIIELRTIANKLYGATNNGIYDLSDPSAPRMLFRSNNTTSLAFDEKRSSYAVATYDLGCFIYPDTNIHKIEFDGDADARSVKRVWQFENDEIIAVHNSRLITIINQDKFNQLTFSNITENKNIYSVLGFNSYLSVISGNTWSIYDRQKEDMTSYRANYKDQVITFNGSYYLISPYALLESNFSNTKMALPILNNVYNEVFLEMEIYKERLVIIRTETKFILFDPIKRSVMAVYSMPSKYFGKIFSFHIDRLNALWFSSSIVGICRFEVDNGNFARFENNLGDDFRYYFSNNTENLVAYNNNNIFLYDSTNKVLNSVCHFVNEKINDVMYHEGKFVVGTNNGIVTIDTHGKERLKPNDYLKFSSIKANGAEIDAQNLEFPFDVKNKIEIEVALVPGNYLNFNRPAYRIIGFDAKWRTISTNSFVLPTLPHGKYVVELGIQQHDGKFVPQDSKISIVVLEPFWNRFYVKIVILILVILFFLIIIFIILKFNKLVRRKNETKIAYLQMERKKAEAEYKSFFLQINPHFIFNTINNIKNVYSTGDRERGDKYVHYFAKSMRTVLEFSDMNYITIEQEVDYLTSYCNIFLFSFDFRYEFILEDEDFKYLEIPPMILQPFVENALIHGLQNKTSGDRKLKITFSYDKQKNLVIEIADNGAGRNRKNVSRKYNKTSKGLNITQKRLEFIYGMEYSNSFITFEDLVDENQEPLGTKVTILIPIYA